MEKIKKLWNENRVMFVLGIIVIVCILIMMGVMLKYFFGTSSSSYGDRLESIESIPFTEDAQNQIKENLTSEHLISVSVDVRGKVIYVIMKYDHSVSLAEAQSKAVEVYNKVDEKYRKLYDFNATVVQDATEESSGYRLMGAKNVSSDNFVWNNNTPIDDGE